MFKLVIAVYLLAIGQPTGSSMQFENKLRFDTQAECMAYPKSEAGAVEYNTLMNTLAQTLPEGHSLTATTSCEKLEGEAI